MLSLRDAVAEALLPKPTQPPKNGPLVPKPTVVWECVNDAFDYSDYEHYVDDVNGYGVRLRISLHHEYATAYVTLIIDDEHGERYLEGTISKLPYAVAAAMTNHPTT
jgi:hypothetical protein